MIINNADLQGHVLPISYRSGMSYGSDVLPSMPFYVVRYANTNIFIIHLKCCSIHSGHKTSSRCFKLSSFFTNIVLVASNLHAWG